jgi:4-hydroxy-3-polyprenylbenzoate decarboxylase
MAYRSFRNFLDALEQAGELKRISVPVDTDLLIAEWADREMKSPGGGKALFFEQPVVDGKKSEFPVAINTMGSRRRMALALQVADIGDIAQEIQLILKAKPPTDLREGWSLLKQGIHLLHARPKHVREAQCQEIVYKIDNGTDFSLADLPILKCWPKDGGREMSAFTGCKSTTSARPECTGKSTRSAHVMANAITSAANACRSR